MKLFFLTDNHYISNGKTIVPLRGDIGYFIAEFHKFFDEISICVPVIREVEVELVSFSWPSKIKIIPLEPYGNFLSYVLRLPLIVWRNLPILLREIPGADTVWLLFPSMNTFFGYLFARLYRKNICIFVVGDVAKVSRVNPRYHGWKSLIQRIGSWAYWRLLVLITRNNLTFAYGSELSNKIKSGGGKKVYNTFTSLIREKEIRKPDLEFNGNLVTLLYVGRLSIEKGISHLLNAAAALAESGYQVDVKVVGDGPEKDELMLFCEKIKNRDLNFEFEGYVPAGPDLDRLFNCSDIFVLPSRSEGIPKVLLKAMAHGLPIVSTNVGGIPDIVSQGQNGLLVSSDNEQDLVDAIKRIIQQPDLREELVTNGYKFVNEHTIEKQSNQIYQIWDQNRN